MAESLLDQPNRLVYLAFVPDMELLPLIAESLALLPPSRRWGVSFSTYFTSLPSDVACTVRGVLRDSEEAKAARRLPNALVLDLTRSLGRAEGGALVQQARTGVAPAVVAPVAPPPLPEPEPVGPRPGRSVKPASSAPPPPEADAFGFADTLACRGPESRTPVSEVARIDLALLACWISHPHLRDREQQARQEEERTDQVFRILSERLRLERGLTPEEWKPIWQAVLSELHPWSRRERRARREQGQAGPLLPEMEPKARQLLREGPRTRSKRKAPRAPERDPN